MKMNQIRLLAYLVFVAGTFANILGMTVAAQTNTLSQLSSQLCTIVGDVRDVIGVFALVLFIIGGVLYAAAHFLPAAGQIRGNLQGWSMGMIIGGIIGIILVIAAPAIVNIVTGFGSGTLSSVTC